MEVALAEQIDWFNHQHLHGEIGPIPPVEYANNQYRHQQVPALARLSIQSLHWSRGETPSRRALGGKASMSGGVSPGECVRATCG